MMELGSLVFVGMSRYFRDMATLHISNIPDALHERLRRYARKNNQSMSAVVRAAVERELARWEWREHLARRIETDLGVEVAALLAEERSLGGMELG